jgi:hypothetical protein
MSKQSLAMPETKTERDTTGLDQDTVLTSNNHISSPDIVAFGGDEDLENPLNWSKKRKWSIVALLSLMQTMV